MRFRIPAFAIALLTPLVSFGQTAYDRVSNSDPRNVFVLYSGAESQYAAKDISSNIASKKKWKVGEGIKDKVIQLSYVQFEQTLRTSKDAVKFKESFDDVNSTVIVVDCAKDAGSLPESVYGEVRRMGGPVALRRSNDQRMVLPGGKPLIWSNFRAFSANNEGVENNELFFVLAADSLEDIEKLKSKLGETSSDDRPPIYPENPFSSLNAFPVAVLPIRSGAIDPKLAPASGYIAERLASLITSLGMRQVERGIAENAILEEAKSQERGEYTAQDGQSFGERLGADVVATGVIRKLELNRGGNLLDRHWTATIEMSIKLVNVKTGEVVFDTGAIRGTSKSKAGNILTDAIAAQDSKPAGNTNLWGGLESDAVRAAERALKNGLFIFEMGMRAKCDEVSTRLTESYKDRGAPIDWQALKRRFEGSKFAIRIPETIIQRPVPDPAVETGLTRALTQAGVDMRDPSTVHGAVDDLMVGRLLKGQVAAGDRRRIQKALGADVLITGEAFAKILAPINGMSAAQARTEVKVISLKTGRILAADSREVTQQAASEEVAGKRALEKTARVLAQSSPFWESLATNLEVDRKEWAALTADEEKEPAAGGPASAPVKLDGITFMVAIAPGQGVASSFVNQLETAAIAKLMDASAEVLDPSRAEELKKLAVFDAIAAGSSSNYRELKAACPADVLIIGKIDSTAGARGSAIQVSWKAIWMSDGKMIGAGSELGFVESADPAEQMMASKDVADKLVGKVAATVSKNKPQNRSFRIEVQQLKSATQAEKVKKAILGAFPGASGSFRAGTLTLTLKLGPGLTRETIVMRLEQKLTQAKIKIRVLSSDASSIRATLVSSG